MTAHLPDTDVLTRPRFDFGAFALPAVALNDGQATAARNLEDAGHGPANLGSPLAAIDFAKEKFDFLKAESQWNVGKAEIDRHHGR